LEDRGDSTPALSPSCSSVSHWDTTATPNMLMEPFINTELGTKVKHPEDLSWNLLRDLGW